ncbi:hypothetical protein TNCV_4044721 [Trichonephila clavipes]|nr:hypothetical protein TNCV_4044721 [Trichonephila clavipes]
MERKLTERYLQVLKQIVMSEKRTIAAKVIAELNRHLDSPASVITVRRMGAQAYDRDCLLSTVRALRLICHDVDSRVVVFCRINHNPER